MIISNKDLMAQARASLSGKWGMAIGGFFVYMLITMGLSILTSALDMFTIPTFGDASVSPISSIVSLIIGGPFMLGIAIFTLAIARGDEDAKMEQVFDGFKDFSRAFVANILVTIFTLLWTLLLIIPGIIASLAYSQVFFILADDKEISTMDAIRKSKAMMDGYKGKFFCLNLRFIGWALLCVLTLGIGMLWLMPYMYTSFAKFHDEVKANYTPEIAE